MNTHPAPGPNRSGTSALSCRFLACLAVVWAQIDAVPGRAQSPSADHSPYSQWKHGPPTDPGFFPIAVWLQSPRHAAKYRAAGINTYVGLWNGPTEDQLAELKKEGMKVVCSQTEVGLSSPNRAIIIAWMHGDEPDNAQPRAGGGYGPPISPGKIQSDYAALKTRDPDRPIFLNLGQGVAYDQYIGRGVRRNHPEDYREYILGCDIASFDIYPAVHDKPEVAGRLEFVPNGVQRLREWSDDRKIVWNCIEASRISNTEVKPTPAQVRSEVWMSLIAGSRGLIYFVHQFEPQFREASLLDDPELLTEVTRINQQIRELAPVLNSPSLTDSITLKADETQVKWMCKARQNRVYLFLANHTPETAQAAVRFNDATLQNAGYIERLSDRTGTLADQEFTVSLEPYGVAVYQIARRDQ
jgi:hypothetical protein